MKTKSLLLTFLLVISVLLSACAKETETTISGLVILKEGTVIYLMELNSNRTRESNTTQNEADDTIPSLPDEGFNPDETDGSRQSRPDRGFNRDEADGSRPNRSDRNFNPDEADPTRRNRSERNFNIDDLTKIDIKDAHISIEIDEGKEAGTIDDVKEGSRVTIVLKGGKAENVLVSSTRRNDKWNRDNRNRSN